MVVATGGRSLPKTGSDGGGYALVRSLGHTVTPRVFPGLVPLTLPRDHPLCTLSGLAVPATLEVRSAAGRRGAAFTGLALCTHFGLSGPAVLDVSRHLIAARLAEPAAAPGGELAARRDRGGAGGALRGWGRRPLPAFLAERVPERLARACARWPAWRATSPGTA